MKDMVTNGTGNSRFLKSSLASGTTWETALAQLRAGTFPVDFNGLNTGGITQQGSAYSKANVLPDDVCELLGLNSTTAEPKDAFQVVGNPAELWVWEKNAVTAEAHYELGEVQAKKGSYNMTNAGEILTISTAITVAYDGTVTQSGTITTLAIDGNCTAAILQSAVRGKFFTSNKAATWNNLAQSTVVYCSNSVTATFSGNSNPCATLTGVQFVEGYGTELSVVGYVTSPTSTTYPEDGRSGDYWYTRLGQLGGGARIETGSYAGTGTYGVDNPNSLTFGFVPKVVIVGGADNISGVRYRIIMIYGSPYATSQPGSGQNDIYLSWSGKTVSWYNRNGINTQMNMLYTYYYIAIG